MEARPSPSARDPKERILKQIRRHLTYANVMSSIAVFLMLGGATAFAATKIGANEIKANSIKTGKIVKEAVTAGKIKNGAVTEGKIADGAVTTNKIADNAVATSKIANDAVTGDKVKESSLGEVPLAANANKLGGQTPSSFEPRVQWASVASDGTILEQSGGITMLAHSGNGYYIDFGSSVVGRGTFVTFRYLDPDFDGFVASEPCAGPSNTLTCSAAPNNPNVLFVQTHTAANAATAEGFNVLITP
jgi:hypothetical protein